MDEKCEHFTCSMDTTVLVKKLANLKKNSAALTSLKTKLDSAASRRFVIKYRYLPIIVVILDLHGMLLLVLLRALQ